MAYNPSRFADRFLHARENALHDNAASGLSGFELEWNLLDSNFYPLLTVGTGPGQQSFVDYLRAYTLPADIHSYSQLEVFHWMIEWATRPYYSLKGAVYEGRLMEALLLRALHKVGREFGQDLYTWHGNLLYPVQVGRDSIPDSWHLAKRRYLERCVDLYGDSLATAGIHTNLSLPEPLLALDFMHLPASQRRDMHLDEYKSEFYITATRLLRAFAALFIATGASTPLKATDKDGSPAVLLTGMDSVRSLTFPNPEALDVPYLYRSYSDYLRVSYDLVRRGERFGNNNWTPVRARSFAEPVERLITVTSEQLGDVYGRGLYVLTGEGGSVKGQTLMTGEVVDNMAHQIEIQNLLARINLPMARVEVRTDDGGGGLDLDIANLTLKYLLLLRIYADSEFARGFRYDAEDIHRARCNEEWAARDGLRAEIENPLTGKPVGMRTFLSWTLDQVRPLAELLGMWDDLAPLEAMASGGLNVSESLRHRLLKIMGGSGSLPRQVPFDLLIELAKERSDQVAGDLETIRTDLHSLDRESGKLEMIMEVLPRLDEQPVIDPPALTFSSINMPPPDKTVEIIELAQALIRIPSVTACPQERLEDVLRAHALINSYMSGAGMEVRSFNSSKYPALLCSFPGQGRPAGQGQVLLSGHFDVVPPDPDDRQFEPRIEGDYLWGRGAADMKTVVATYMVWMKDALKAGPPYPAVNLLLVGNEENGETEPVGTPHALSILKEGGWMEPGLLIAGERTEESGRELWGEICVENRGLMRFELAAAGQRGHTGVVGARNDLLERLLQTRSGVEPILQRNLSLNATDGWMSQVQFPFIRIGTPGVYNVSPGEGVLGVEVRSIPQDDLMALKDDLEAYCHENQVELRVSVMENGIACSPDNPLLLGLMQAVLSESRSQPKLGKKLAGTSARFAPNGQGIVWGQSGIGPHAQDERHYIPSILPYYRVLDRFGKTCSSVLNSS